MQQATTFRADETVFDKITAIAESVPDPSVNGYNKTLVYLVNNYQPTKKRMEEMEKTIVELQKFKANALQVMKLEKQLNDSKKILRESM
ncbi:hypothetical protein [Rufibacter sp. XAAS-G3-1]|uniref:hypothetical protein n=1 Tax=Rufibacter sp. XAAS-G3-1 TaxID=2729134 RepID=UPI0015E7A19E|nr:hypothetical protein [Rufibacter sp. XAAS-G3-1]